MNKDILEQLLACTEEEKRILNQEEKQKERYSKSGRFMIERRRISEMTDGDATAAISMRKHTRFCEFPAHSHDYIEMMYVCNGNITHVIKGESIRLKAHDIILLGRYTRHSILPTGENDIGINIIVSADLFGSLYRKMAQSSELRNKNIESLMEKGLSKDLVERTKKVIWGDYIKSYNDIEDFSHAFLNLYMADAMYTDYEKVYSSVTYEDVMNRFKNLYSKDKTALSVINPL